MVEKIVNRRLFIPDAKVAEAREDLDRLLNPANLITFNDGYFSKSLREKWGMSSDEMQQLVGKPKITVTWEKV